MQKRSRVIQVQWITGGERIHFIQGRQRSESTYNGLTPGKIDTNSKPYLKIVGGIPRSAQTTWSTKEIIEKLMEKLRRMTVQEKGYYGKKTKSGVWKQKSGWR